MDYHLHHDGQNLDEFPLEELGRRRAAGKLTEAEDVWREGMADWLTLNAVLQAGALLCPGLLYFAPAGRAVR